MLCETNGPAQPQATGIESSREAYVAVDAGYESKNMAPGVISRKGS